MEASVVLWTVQVSWLVNAQAETHCPVASDEMPGLDRLFGFWTQRQSELRMLDEQLDVPPVARMVQQLEKVQSEAAGTFHQVWGELKACSEAADTMVRHMEMLRPLSKQLEQCTLLLEAFGPVRQLVHAIWLLWRHAPKFGEAGCDEDLMIGERPPSFRSGLMRAV